MWDTLFVWIFKFSQVNDFNRILNMLVDKVGTTRSCREMY